MGRENASYQNLLKILDKKSFCPELYLFNNTIFIKPRLIGYLTALIENSQIYATCVTQGTGLLPEFWGSSDRVCVVQGRLQFD
jgi:hypothetical protein